LLYLAALYQKILEMCEGIGQAGAGGRGNGNGSGGGGGFGRGSSSSDEGIASKGEGLLDLLGELDITQQSYSQYLQALLMDVRRGRRGCLSALPASDTCLLLLLLAVCAVMFFLCR
jgi:hypothetical protein